MTDKVPIHLKTTLGPKEYAEVSGIGVVQIRNWCLKGVLPSFKIGDRVRIHREAADEALKSMALEGETKRRVPSVRRQFKKGG